jgi:EF hand
MARKLHAVGQMKVLASVLLLFAGVAHADDRAINRYFDSLDLNGDGYVSLSEAAGQEVVVSRFDRADRNKDGKLSRKEFANLSKVKVRVAKKKGEEPSAAVGGSAPKKKEKPATGG